MKSMPAKQDPQTSPWEPMGVLHTIQRGGKTRSAAERKAARHGRVRVRVRVRVRDRSISPVSMPTMILRRSQHGEAA